ncbi:hypothetical protein SCLCIDRAFT_446915 [Scleroderma citrinum Foug A]|uniref:Uncharacterized protein n=1 Tax=Scleroderma citrinum Foug A TaxID=1036808 RepID=A0A0C3CXN0_9AGAM|nr:hypothetical protein SCLCIDRAFT_446915 [Scleroderma citrinum Foug A]
MMATHAPTPPPPTTRITPTGSVKRGAATTTPAYSYPHSAGINNNDDDAHLQPTETCRRPHPRVQTTTTQDASWSARETSRIDQPAPCVDIHSWRSSFITLRERHVWAQRIFFIRLSKLETGSFVAEFDKPLIQCCHASCLVFEPPASSKLVALSRTLNAKILQKSMSSTFCSSLNKNNVGVAR